jgi:hypothetical protein
MSETRDGTYHYDRDELVRSGATVFFTVAIAFVGAMMMVLTSSPLVKGAAFLWLPAALQLIAGVWLGPLRGFIAGGVGAQVAGIIAYGGWAPADFIMNLVAGGFANSLLPALLFRWLKIDPALGSVSVRISHAAIIVVSLTAFLIILALAQLFLASRVGVDLGG